VVFKDPDAFEPNERNEDVDVICGVNLALELVGNGGLVTSTCEERGRREWRLWSLGWRPLIEEGLSCRQAVEQLSRPIHLVASPIERAWGPCAKECDHVVGELNLRPKLVVRDRP